MPWQLLALLVLAWLDSLLPWQPSTQALAIDARRREPELQLRRGKNISVTVSLVLSVFKGKKGIRKSRTGAEKLEAEHGAVWGKKRGLEREFGSLWGRKPRTMKGERENTMQAKGLGNKLKIWGWN